jgi:hypothetical protein
MRSCVDCNQEKPGKFIRKLCRTCYVRHHRAGDLYRYSLSQLEDRFFAKVRFPSAWSACWKWVGARNPIGYGKMTVDNRSIEAHRVSYELAIGPVPGKMDIDHLCCNRSCVNPQHLEPVTHAENIRRGYERKRLLQD